jgi:hypothetical protein
VIQTLAALLLLAVAAHADLVETNLSARAILDRVQTSRALKDFSLKARLFVTRDQVVPVTLFVKNTPAETRTLYRAGQTEFLVWQQMHEDARLFLRGVGELTGAVRSGRLLDSEFSYYDLALPFLQWANPKLLGDDRVRGQDCFVLEVKATGQPYARAKLWIHRDYFALLRAEVFDADDNLVKRFAITSFKRLGEIWIPRGLEVAALPPGQSLPSELKSRLEIYEGDYDKQLPAEWFDEKKLVLPKTGQ